MPRLNTVVPIRPREINDSPMSQAWQKWLGSVGAYSDLADSIIYRHIPQQKMNTAPVSIPNNNTLPNIVEDGNILKKVAPSTKRITGEVNDAGENNLGTFQRRKPGFNTRGNIIVSGGVQDRDTWRHEVQHAILDKMDYKNRPNPEVFFDRDKKKFVPYPKSEDAYFRSQDEILANKAMQNKHPGLLPPPAVNNNYAGIKPQTYTDIMDIQEHVNQPYVVPPESRVISIRPKFMQNLGGIVKGALPTLGVAGSVGQVLNTVNQMQDIKNRGGGWVKSATPELPIDYR